MTAHGGFAPSIHTRPRVVTGIRTLCVCATLQFVLGGCGKSTNSTDSAPLASRPDVTVKFDGKRRKCIVALPSEAQGSTISCDEVVSFIKDELRVPSNSIYDVDAIPDSDSDSHQAEIAKVRSSLDGAGYRFIGGPHNGR